MNHIVISIIIPVYNTSNYVVSCLDSIISQKKVNYKNFEIICVDDGSTDNSAQLLQSYIEAHKSLNIKLYQKENGGVSSARNFGLLNSFGKYVWFIDSDDLITQSSLKKFIDILETGEDYDVVSGKLRYINDLDYKNVNLKTTTDFYSSRHYHCTSCINRNFLNTYKLKYAEGLAYGEDIMFFEMCQARARKTKYINSVVYLYRQRKGSAMNSSTGEKYINSLYARLLIYDNSIRELDNTQAKKFLIRRKNEVIRNILFHYLRYGKSTAQIIIENLRSKGYYPYTYAWDDLKRWHGYKDWLIKLYCFLFPCKSYYILMYNAFRKIK